MSTSEQRPATANASSSAPPTEGAGAAPSFPASKLSELNQRPSTAAALSSSYVNRTMPKVSSPLARHSITVAPDREEPVHRARPVSSSTSALPISTQHDQFPTTYSRPHPLDPPEFFPRPDSSHSSQDRPSSGARPSTGASKEHEHAYSSPNTDEPSFFPTVPSSSAMLSTHRQSSEVLLPPRRELPFARSTPPKSAGSDSARPVSRASSGSSGRPPSRPADNDSAQARNRTLSGTMGPPPLPATASFRRSPSFEQSSAMEVNSPRQGHAPMRRTPSFSQVMEIDTPSFEQTSHMETANEQTSMRPTSSPRPPSRQSNQPFNTAFDLPPLPKPTFVDHNDPPPLSQPTFVENNARAGRTSSSPASYGVATSNEQHTPRPFRTLSSAAQNTLPPNPFAQATAHANLESPPASRQRPDSGGTHQAHMISEIENAAHANAGNGLASFAAKSEDEQRAILNDFMMEAVNDDSFITLCESVATCWARIGLGLP